MNILRDYYVLCSNVSHQLLASNQTRAEKIVLVWRGGQLYDWNNLASTLVLQLPVSLRERQDMHGVRSDLQIYSV